jgi:hypothetical protein
MEDMGCRRGWNRVAGYRWLGTDGPGFAGRYVDGWAWYRWLVWPEGLVSQDSVEWKFRKEGRPISPTEKICRAFLFNRFAFLWQLIQLIYLRLQPFPGFSQMIY